MNGVPLTTAPVDLVLATPEQTTALAEWIAPQLQPGDVVLVEGQIGAGKSHFCRGVIQARLRDDDRIEDVPSPTFTLVQVYSVGGTEIWHADLYRLNDPDEIAELGLEEAFSSAICLVEWPGRLGPLAPESALTVGLSMGNTGERRVARLTASNRRWAPLLSALHSKWQPP